MSLNERSGRRDLLYSQWHRPASIRRYLGVRRAALLKVIDIDWCECCQFCSEPIALIETQRSSSIPKPATITVALAARAQVPAFSVSFVANADGSDIERFRWRRLWPEPIADADMTPGEYAEWLWSLRTPHEGVCSKRKAA